MRLIDADALIERLKPYIDKYGAEEFPYYMVHEAFIYEIGKEPTADAVPVVRCKDCNHYDGYHCHNKWWGDGYGNYTPPIKADDGFCDWAERREE